MHEGQPKRSLSEALPQPITDGLPNDAELVNLSPRHREALEKLEQGYARATSSEGFRAYLDVLSHLYQYSARNVMLIFAQKPDAKTVNSFDRWKASGRQVRRGERGLKIFFPMFRVVTLVNDDGNEERRQVLTGFGLGTVFDISQTDGPPIEQPKAPEERFGVSSVTRLLDRKASAFAIGEGLRLEKRTAPGARGGYDPDTRLIVLNEDLPDDDGKLKTLVHELAHHLAGDTAGDTGLSLKELIAEGTAYATLHAFGIDTGAYSLDYLKWFTREPDAMKIAMPQIALQTKRLIAAIAGEDPDQMEAWL